MRTRLTLLIVTSLLFVSGCTHGWQQQTVTFGQFEVRIDWAFREAPAGLIENKQILNKVIKSFKKESELAFSTNLIITRSDLPAQIDFEQYRTANSSKIRAFLVGYEDGSERSLSFTCEGESIQGIYATFTVSNTFLWNGGPYYFSQYQFVHDNKGYILSYATSSAGEQEELLDIINTLSC